ncbi:Unknown protein sequence [Pseudomonas savastanoi pv. glycinea]|nr:Unknown protein sequence [Pseudomonas amygdali pv. mellea]KPC28034.1 Unknown protein sequence [Pseudomonas savastanoi pv. glycinea]KPC44306.1 Unknown protein sequence [Pseudomonas savastanoi pv. glycinea]
MSARLQVQRRQQQVNWLAILIPLDQHLLKPAAARRHDRY